MISYLEIDSIILTNDEKDILFDLLYENSRNMETNFELIYRASRDGWNATDFHKHCDNKGTTLSIIYNDTENVFGGYTKIPWTSHEPDKYVKDKDAFIYLLRSSKKYKPEIFNVINSNEAVNHYYDDMVVYGSGFDIRITNECNEHDWSYVNGHGYNIPTKNRYMFNGDNYKEFKVKEIEIFLLSK